MNQLSSLHNHGIKYIRKVDVVNGSFNADYTADITRAQGTGQPMTGWTNSGGCFYAGYANNNSPIIFPDQSYGNFCMVQFYSTNPKNWTTSQNIYFPYAKSYTLRFNASVRAGTGYVNTHQITASIVGVSGSVVTGLNSNYGWIPYSWVFTVPSAGTYTLKFNVVNTGANADTAVGFSNITIV